MPKLGLHSPEIQRRAERQKKAGRNSLQAFSIPLLRDPGSRAKGRNVTDPESS